ncbi:MAG: ABC transporter substrate-binding protein [Bacteroidales bacterium]
MNIKLFVYFFIIIGIWSCTSQSPEENCDICGGNLIVEIPSKPNTLFPPAIEDEVSANIVHQFHMGLVRYNPSNLTINPGIARTWDVDNTGKKYVFYLDSTAVFHDSPCFSFGKGRGITAYDVQYTLRYLATPQKHNENFAIVSRIKGAKEYYLNYEENPTAEIPGITIINDYTIQLELETPASIFLYNLARPAASIIPYEGVDEYGADMLVGAGPFVCQNVSFDNTISLKKNQRFFKTDNQERQLPYLDSVTFLHVQHEEQTVHLFVQHKLDALLYVSSDIVPSIVDSLEKSGMKDYVLYTSTQSSHDNQHYMYNVVSKNIRNLYTNDLHLLDAMNVYKQN